MHMWVGRCEGWVYKYTKMRKYMIHIGLLLVGGVLGWVFREIFFTQDNTQAEKHAAYEEVWTCSMDPEIRQSMPGNCPICGMSLTLITYEAPHLDQHMISMKKHAINFANIQTFTIQDSTQSVHDMTLFGKIMPHEKTYMLQPAFFSGRVERLYIHSVGEEVRKGQLLATIYSAALYTAQQELLTSWAMKELQPQLYQAARNKLRFMKITDHQIDTIEKSGIIQENIPVYATVSGTVLEKLVEVGDPIQVGQALLKVADLSTVWATFEIYESQLPYLQVGQSIEVTSVGYPNSVYQSKISLIDPMFNSQTRTLKVKAALPNPNKLWKLNMFIQGKYQVLEGASVRVPATAVLWTGKRSIVYVKTRSNPASFRHQSIILGKRIDDDFIVLSGLKVGDEVVIHGTFLVDAAAQLQGKHSMIQ